MPEVEAMTLRDFVEDYGWPWVAVLVLMIATVAAMRFIMPNFDAPDPVCESCIRLPDGGQP